MADKDKPVDDVKPAKEPKAEEPKVEEPKAEEAKPAGTDQSGRQLFSVVCATCGKQTEVPFKPTGDRPVYCRDCYMKRREGS